MARFHRFENFPKSAIFIILVNFGSIPKFPFLDKKYFLCIFIIIVAQWDFQNQNIRIKIILLVKLKFFFYYFFISFFDSDPIEFVGFQDFGQLQQIFKKSCVIIHGRTQNFNIQKITDQLFGPKWGPNEQALAGRRRPNRPYSKITQVVRLGFGPRN